jgi:hypothetical protein
LTEIGKFSIYSSLQIQFIKKAKTAFLFLQKEFFHYYF